MHTYKRVINFSSFLKSRRVHDARLINVGPVRTRLTQRWR